MYGLGFTLNLVLLEDHITLLFIYSFWRLRFKMHMIDQIHKVMFDYISYYISSMELVS